MGRAQDAAHAGPRHRRALSRGTARRRGLPPQAAYLFHDGEPLRWPDSGLRTLECTKKMLALPLYAALMTRGTRLFADYVDQCFDLSRRFAARLAAAPDFAAIEPQANIVCFRHLPHGPADPDADARQARVRDTIVRSGAFYRVQTRLDGALWLRTTLINPLTPDADPDALVEEIRRS